MITVLGAGGFIGSHIIRKLDSLGIVYYAPNRNENLQDKDLGDIIYCIGLTADFRQHPMETVEAHVCKVLDILQNAKFESFLYLSSTRMYGVDVAFAAEANTFKVNPSNLSDLYNISKIMGESLLHACGHPVHIARLSNVYGKDFDSHNFLSDVIQQAIDQNHVILETTLDSEKDYISIDDAVNILIQIALGGKQVVYNVASGINTSNREIMERLSSLTRCQVDVQPDAREIKFPQINVELTRSEFAYQPSKLMADIDHLVQLYMNQHGE